MATAQTLRVRSSHGINQGLRHHALLAVLLGSGLRVSEALSLGREQYTGKGFAPVHVWRYVKPDQQTRADASEALAC